MSDYCGQPPHGGHKIVHYDLCVGDCGHWDCLGCCGCPSEDNGDLELVERILDRGFGHEWISDWYANEQWKANQEIRTKILEFYSTAPKAANPLLKRLGMEEV